jgi:hypothetical protein
MKKFEFEREVGQVAGGNIQTGSARAYVTFHLHLDAGVQHNPAWRALAVGFVMVAVSLFAFTAYRVITASHVGGEDAPSLFCEYGGQRYSVGSVFKQDSVVLRCSAADSQGAQWVTMPAVEIGSQ